MRRLAPSTGGVAAIHDRLLAFFDAKGTRVAEQKLDKPADAIARFGDDEWLVLGDKQKHLARISTSSRAAPFASGKASIGAFDVGRDDTVAVARGATMELWSRDDERRWSTKGGPFTQVVVARDHVVALGEDGALYFLSRDKGDVGGALRLASPESPSEWRLAHVEGGIVVLALGEWLVWVDSATRKTVRRVRARAKVLEIAADSAHVAVLVEGGFLQGFRAGSGEPRASFGANNEDVCGLALATETLFTMGGSGVDSVRACDRQALDVTVQAASPISAIAARGALSAVGDRTGRVRVFESVAGDLREVGAIAVGEGTVGLSVAKNGTVVAAGARLVMCVPAPWQAPRPIALRGQPTAFAADETYAFTGNQTGAVDVYDLEGGRHVTTYALSSDDRITALARLAGATLIVGTGALDGRVLVVDVAEAKVVHRLSPHDEAFGVTCLAADSRGRIVASGGDDGSVALVDPAKGRVLARIRVNETPTSMAFEPTGRRLACVFADGTAAIVSFTEKAAKVSDLGVRGATHVAWGEGLVFGFKDGHAESGERHTRPSERPAVRQ